MQGPGPGQGQGPPKGSSALLSAPSQTATGLGWQPFRPPGAQSVSKHGLRLLAHRIVVRPPPLSARNGIAWPRRGSRGSGHHRRPWAPIQSGTGAHPHRRISIHPNPTSDGPVPPAWCMLSDAQGATPTALRRPGTPCAGPPGQQSHCPAPTVPYPPPQRGIQEGSG